MIMDLYRMVLMTKYSTIIELNTDSGSGDRVIATWGNSIRHPRNAQPYDRLIVAPHYRTYVKISGSLIYYPCGEKYIKTDTIVDIHLVEVMENVEIMELIHNQEEG